jgi:hypothetical protein
VDFPRKTYTHSSLVNRKQRTQQHTQNMSSIPPHYLRELQRHVRRLPSTATTNNTIVAAAAATTTRNNSNNHVLFGTLSLLGFACSLPMLSFYWVGRSLTDQDEPLSASQIRRGAFLNSGSRDAGRDPKWIRGVYQKDEIYFERRNGNSKVKDIELTEELFSSSQQGPSPRV